MATKEQQIKNSFVYLVPAILGNALPILTLPIFTRILTKEDYGVLALAQTYAIFSTGLANFGLTVGYERNFFEHKELRKTVELLYSTLLFVVIMFLLCGLVTYIFKSPFSRWIIGSAIYGELLFWAFCSQGVMGLKNYYLIYFKNTEDAKAFVWYTVDESILGVVLSLFMVAYLKIGVIGLVLGQLLASLTIFVILSVKFIRFQPVSFNWIELRKSLKLSYPMTPQIFFGIISNQFDKYMIGLMNTVGGVGVYSIGQKIAYVVFTYMTAIQNVFSPQVYKRMFDLKEKGGEAVGRYLTPFCYASLFLALLICLFSEEIIFILTPKSYHGAVDIVIVLSMLYGSYFFCKQPQLIYAKKIFISSSLTIVSIGLNIIINIPFIMKWGAIGAAWGTLLAGLIYVSVVFIVSQHYYKIKWEYKSIGAIYLMFYGSALAMILLRSADAGYGIRLAVKCTAFVTYVYLGMRLDILSRKNYLIVKKILPLEKLSDLLGVRSVL